MAQHKTIDRRKAWEKTVFVPTANAGREHKVIDRRQAWQKQKATPTPAANAGREHKVIDRRQAWQKQTVTVPTAPARGQNVQTGGYYSPREYGAQTGSYEARVTAARTAMEEQGKNLRTSQTEVENLWKAAQDAQTAYQNCRGMFKGASAAQYEQQFLTRWTEAAQSYSQRYQQFEQEYAAYKPYEDAYNAALGEYNAYVSAERAEYDRWRGSIRGAEEIRAEQSQIKSKRAELQRLMQEQNAIASGTAAPGIQAKAAQNEQRIAQLQAYLGGVGDREGLLKEELDWSEHFRFEDLRQNRDFYERSRYREGGGSSLYNQVNTRPGRFHNEFLRDDAFAGIYGRMTDQEVDIYNYLHETQGEEAAKEYIAYLTPELNRRKVEEDTGAIREWSGRNPVNAALATAGSVLLSPLSGIEGAAGMIAAKLRGEEIDPNAAYAQAANWKNAAREGVTESIEENLGKFWGPVGSFAYQTGVSMMDMLADSVAGPGAMALIGTMAFSEGTMDAKRRGLDDTQALMMGATAGAAEVLTERIGLDELLHLPDEWADAGFWKGLLRGAAGEAAEEGLTNLANLAADISIAGEKSEFMQSVHSYREQGMDDQEAVIAALKDAGISLALDALGGAVSGGVFGGIQGWRGKRAADAQQKKEGAAQAQQEEAPSVSEADSSPIPDGTGEPLGKETVRSEGRGADEAVQSPSSVSEADSSPMRGTGEPLGDGAQAVPYERNAAHNNGTTAPDNGTVREDRTAGNTGKQEATVAKNAQVAGGAVGTENATTAGEAVRRADQRQEAQAGKTIDELRRIAIDHRNPLLTGSLNTARQEEELRRIRNAKTRTEVTGIDYGATDEQVKEALRIGKLIGKEVLFAPKGQSYNAFYDRSSDEIHVAPDAENLLAATVGHELTHSIEQTGEWERLRNLVSRRMAQTGVSMESARRERMEKYAEAGLTLTDERAVDQEIVANFVEKNLLTDEQSIRTLVRDEHSVARRILDWLDGLWAKVAKTKGAKEREFVRKAREIYRTALAEAGEQRARQELRRAARDAYAEGDDEGGDAALDAAMGEDLDGLLEDDFDSGDDFDPRDDSTIPFSVREAELKEDAESVDGQILTDGAVVTTGDGRKYSIRSMTSDIAEGQMFADLQTHCGWSKAKTAKLKRELTALVEYMAPNREILDMNETYGREGRKFSPYKPNSDPLYKISMDFSTLCSKRLLTQYVIEQLQLRENRPMTPEEQMAIRDMLNEYRKQEQGIQVACAMCYVEAARLKSPAQMERWMADPESRMRDYFAKKNPEFAARVQKAQEDFKESRGYRRTDPKKVMKARDKTELNRIGPKMRQEYRVSEAEQEIIDRAKALPRSTYLSAGNLAELSQREPEIYAAYTTFIRNATRAKALETAEPYYYGDSRRDNGNGIVVTDGFIESVNRENGMRFSSWSDWRIEHMLDYITAVIDNSVRGAAMHGYTKFPEEVRVLGKTGMMFNMSGVAGTQTGLNPDGSLSFSDTESINFEEAKKLRQQFPETAGLQCIGVSDQHIIALMKSKEIDYVIPYHVSGLNANLRRMADIYGWRDYTAVQHAAVDKGMKLADAADPEHWHEEPTFSEFFVGYDTGMTGTQAMEESARRYVQLCRDRGLKPKFEKFSGEKGYWKLLIDRKMINQKTGRLIRQKPVQPNFDFDEIRAVVDRHVANYDAQLESKALEYVAQNWDTIPDRIRELKKTGKKSGAKKALDTLANETLAAMPKGGRQYSVRSLNTTGMDENAKEVVRGLRDQHRYARYGIHRYAAYSAERMEREIRDSSATNPEYARSAIAWMEPDRFLRATVKTRASYDRIAEEAGDLNLEELQAETQPIYLRVDAQTGQIIGHEGRHRIAALSKAGYDRVAVILRMENTGDGRRLEPMKYLDLKGQIFDETVPYEGIGKGQDFSVRDVLPLSGKYADAARALFCDIGGENGLQYSVRERDSEGRELTAEQREFFKDSKMLDDRGRLKVMYHGSENAGFTRFMVNYAKDLRSFFFTDRLTNAASYSGTMETMAPGKNDTPERKAANMACYLNVRNPLYVETDGATWDNIWWEPTDPDEADEVESFNWDTRGLAKYAKSKGYDGVIIESLYDYGAEMDVDYEASTVAIVFKPEQIKSINNTEPTDDPDIRYSIREMEQEEPGSYEYSDEELAEIDELARRGYMEEDAKGRKEWAPVEREALTGRAKEHLGQVERKLTAHVAAALDVPRQASRDFLKPIVQKLADEYMKQGTISPEVRDRLFETAWEQGRVVDQEFYDTYKEVKDHLRTTKVTLSETDRDSRDWEEFRTRAFGTLKIVNEGGTPVDVLWQELQEMAPALFPDDILNPEDQFRHMYEVGRSIRKVERTLDEHYGSDAAMAKRMTRNDFDAAVADCIHGLWEVKRHADDLREERTAIADEKGAELTVDEVTALYPKLKDVRRELEKAMAKNLLNKQDKNQVQRLLRHDIQPEHLDPEVDNVRGILAVYEAKKAFEEIAKPIREWNRQRKARLYAEAEELVYEAEMAGGIKDKSKGFLYSRETMERNIRDIVKNPEHADRIIDTYFRPVHQAEAAATRMKNQYRERVRALDISRKVRKGDQVSEAYAVQFYGEVSDILRMMEKSKFRLKQRDGKSYKEWKAELQKLWEENPSLDKAKIENAAREMGKIYEELFEQMNQARVENGYEPINHRSGYFPHFQQDGRDGILSQFGKAMGIDVEVQQLPTSINGMTHTFKPGIRWFGNALERKTFDTAYDAVEGFDRYIEGCASVVHQTANIQRLRALANQIRYRTGDEGLREQIRKIQAREDLTDEQKDTLIRETASEGKFQLSNFVVELDEYPNLLANKKSRADRNMEQAMGRDMYNIIKALESRVAANMVAINPGSWLTNFIPITQGWAALDTRYWLTGMGQTIRAVWTDDGMVDMSDFLTNRVGSDALVQTTAQKVSGVLSSPMEWIDGFAAGSLVRARYAQNVAQGMSKAEAMSEADEWTAGVMADRSKGAMPTVFHRSNPLTKVFTQFQLEVNNQLGYMFKDIPREKRKKGVLAVAAALLKLALGAWLYNELYEKFLGRRPALDPIDMAFGFVTDWADPELDFADAAMGLGEKIAENTPFVGGLVGGGRVPISSALPNAENLLKAVGNKEWSGKKRIATAAKELAKPAVYMLPPFGGGQIKKIWEGLKMIRQGGSYTVDADGNPMLQYTLYSTDNAVQKALEAGQAMIFGKTTIRSGREWVEGGFGSLSAKQTATYQALIAMDVEQADAFELLTGLRSAEKEGDKPRTAVQRDILRASGLEGDALATVYYDLMVEDGSEEKALLESLQSAGADMGKVASCLMDMKDAYLLGGAAGSNAMRDALRASGLTDGQKQEIYHTRISDERDDDIEAFRSAGMDMDDFLEVHNQYTAIKENYEDEGDMATAFARWVNGQSYTAEQKSTVRDCFKYWNMIPANADRYDRAIAAGLDDDEAFELTEDLKDLGKNPKDVQKWRVGIDNAWAEENQLQQLKAVGMDEKTYAKCEALWDAGVAPAAYVRAQEIKSQYDSDGNGNLTNEDWRNLINSMVPSGIVLPGDNERFNLTSEQMGFLWQMLTGNKSTKNNPFSKTGGEKWLEIKNAGK